MVKRLRSLDVIGVRQQFPRRQREEDDPVSDRPCCLPDARPGRRSGVPAELQPPNSLPHPPGACRRVYRQLIVPCPNAVMEIEAKVRRYTGRRCICPHRRLRWRGRFQPWHCRHYCGRDWRVTDHFCLRLDHQARAGGRRVWLNWQGASSQGASTNRVGRVGPWQCPTGFPAGPGPSHPVSASRGKWVAVWPKEPNGALKGAILYYPNEAACSAPSEKPWPQMAMGPEIQSSHGQHLPRERIGAFSRAPEFFDRIRAR